MERLDCVECCDVREEVWAKELIAHRCGNEGAGRRLGYTVGSPKPEPYKNMPIEPPAWCPRAPRPLPEERDPQTITFVEWCRMFAELLKAGDASDPHKSRRKYLAKMIRETLNEATKEEYEEGKRIVMAARDAAAEAAQKGE